MPGVLVVWIPSGWLVTYFYPRATYDGGCAMTTTVVPDPEHAIPQANFEWRRN